MTGSLLLFQILNGLQYGVMLSLLAGGLTLVFGILNFVNLAHGSLYMLGAFAGAATYNTTQSFIGAVATAVLATAIIGLVVERTILARFYDRGHLDQVLATFGLILVSNEAVRSIWGAAPTYMSTPEGLSEPIEILGMAYPSYRLLIVGVGLAFAAASYLLIHRTRFGMLVRAAAEDSEIVGLMGVNPAWLKSVIFTLGAALAGMAGILAAPIVSVEPGMGESILILTIVVIVIGGVGSIRGAFLAAMLVGVLDTAGRTLIGPLLAMAASRKVAGAAGPALASVLIYVVMAVVLAYRPDGLFPVKGR